MSTPPPREDPAAWLLECGLRDESVEEIIAGLGKRLRAAGLPVDRIGLGGVVLNPLFGATDAVWDARSGSVTSQLRPRGALSQPELRNAPFYWAFTHQPPLHRFHFEAGPVEPDFPVFSELRAGGITDYLLMYQGFGRPGEALWSELPNGVDGAIVSMATRRAGGFPEPAIAAIRGLMLPLALALKSSRGQVLTRELMETYLGRRTGSRVLEGVVGRGDGGAIDCVLFYCDLRRSSEMAERLPLDRYLALLNDYFDCTAGAVAEHGGEVLKFIGDAVMAIFPIEEGARPAAEACRAALAAAQEAFARAAEANARWEAEGARIRFGIALHTGRVMYGNVGTESRLDFTTIGPAVNMVTRLEEMCKPLGAPLVASEQFRADHGEGLASLGRHHVPYTAHAMELFTLPGMAPGGDGAAGASI